jgi:peptidoglycan/LPS O-acetylase OafA/YrhL
MIYKNKSKNFIQEIQSLRGISIIFVFLFHINKEIFKFGYLGVDIFFVISGFLITKLIYEKLIINNFILNNFYISRFLRLFPALIIMILSVNLLLIVTYSLHGNPGQLINTGILSLVGLSNFYLIFLENDYFNIFDQNIFEHTWSLSIELQFYLFFPFLMLILVKFFKNNINLYLYFFSCVFFIYLFSIIFLNQKQFYNSFLRSGEFILGSIVFFLFCKNYKKLNLFFFLSIIFLISFLFTNNIFFIILSVCFFSSFYILTLTSNFFLKKFLHNKLLYFFGNLSYSLYLWHFPVIFFCSMFFVGFDYYLFSILFSLLFSIISFFFVENFFRYLAILNTYFFKKIFLYISIIFILLFVLGLVYIELTNSRNIILTSVDSKYIELSKFFNTNNSFKKEERHNLICHENYGKNILKTHCFDSVNQNRMIYFFGDSSMLDFFFSFQKFDGMDKLFSSYNNSSFIKPIGYNNSPAFYDLNNNINIFSSKYEQIYLVMSFMHNVSYARTDRSPQYYSNQETAYRNFVKNLPQNVKIIFIKDTPFFRYSRLNCENINRTSFSFISKIENNKKCDVLKKDIFKKMDKTYLMFENLEKNLNIKVMDINEYFCDDLNCEFYKKKNNIITFSKKIDGVHFSPEASEDITGLFNNTLNSAIIKIK